ncbi:MAG: hypothetical protein FWH08_00890 [Oscillospiraceae bacterium]|nr:hypothetical protein [Oscillospiraceae bacterium]
MKQEIKKSLEELERLPDYMANIIGVNLLNGKTPTEHGVVYIDDKNDTLNILFNCMMERELNYILKIFINYAEAQFIIDKELYNKYEFTADEEDSIVIPFTLHDEIDLSYSNIITIAIFVDDDLIERSVCLDFELAKTGNDRIIENVQREKGEYEFVNLLFQGIMLNEDFDFSEKGEVFFPPEEIAVKANEKITLAFRAGNYSDTDDVLFLLLVGWEQVEINEKQYEYVSNKEGYISCGTIKFYAPSTPGRYEVLSFISADPFQLRTANNFFTNETSRRFTLVVTD